MRSSPAKEGGAAGPHLILGTAGHIDHGKTALCRALTGVDTDRLPEEKRRGITLELGFAPLTLPGGAVLGVVDVPGHEGLVRTMVAGAAGIDLLLLVVAADEGVMPQTREHLAIAELLGLDRGVVALSKLDAVDEEVAGLAAEEVRELLAPTPLADAPILPVSAHTGAGVEALRQALAALAAEAAPRTPRRGPPRLPVDRCFEMRGFGPVVTGTLLGAPLRVGDAVELLPGGDRARVRGLQCHGGAVDEALPGTRCAVNLQGVALADLARGQVLCTPDSLAPTSSLDARVDWLPGSPPVEEPTPVTFLAGTSERLARLAPIGAERLEAGSAGLARLHLEGEPLALLPGDAFVLRGFARGALGATLGGGRVLDVAPPHRRRSDPTLVAELEAFAAGRDALVLRVRRAGLAGVPTAALRRELGLDAAGLQAEIAAAGDSILAAGERLVHAESAARIEARLAETVAAYHEAEPLRPGMPGGSLRGALPLNVPPALTELALERLLAGGTLVREGEHVRAAAHRPRIDAATRDGLARIRAVLAEAGLEAPSQKDLAARVGADEPTLRDWLAFLEREGAVVGARGGLWFDAAAVEALRARVRTHFAEHEALDTQAYKALVGTTRRTAVPLMELLDEEKLTVRRGELRRPGPAYSSQS